MLVERSSSRSWTFSHLDLAGFGSLFRILFQTAGTHAPHGLPPRNASHASDLTSRTIQSSCRGFRQDQLISWPRCCLLSVAKGPNPIPVPPNEERLNSLDRRPCGVKGVQPQLGAPGVWKEQYFLNVFCWQRCSLGDSDGINILDGQYGRPLVLNAFSWHIKICHSNDMICSRQVSNVRL